MKRRSILTLTGGSALGVVLPAMGQPERVAHVGQLGNRPASEPNNVAFHKVVADLMKLMGWEMGRNLVWHYKSGLTNLRQQITNAKELVAEKVDVILASNSEATAAAFEVTKSIPIVMLGAAAVELGYAKSLARPGGNITGMVYQSLDFSGKELELLLALQPGLKKIGFSESLELPEVGMYFKNWQNFAAANGVTMVLLPNVLTLTDIEPLLAAAKREGVQALVIGGVRYFLVGAGLQRIQEWATANKVLTYGGTWQPGQLLAGFGPDGSEIIPVLCRQIDRILRGAKPADIPIEQPKRFNLLINQKIAKAIGLKIPQSVLLRATQVLD